jgi:hypothetical protein
MPDEYLYRYAEHNGEYALTIYDGLPEHQRNRSGVGVHMPFDSGAVHKMENLPEQLQRIRQLGRMGRHVLEVDGGRTIILWFYTNEKGDLLRFRDMKARES